MAPRGRRGGGITSAEATPLCGMSRAVSSERLKLLSEQSEEVVVVFRKKERSSEGKLQESRLVTFRLVCFPLIRFRLVRFGSVRLRGKRNTTHGFLGRLHVPKDAQNDVAWKREGEAGFDHAAG